MGTGWEEAMLRTAMGAAMVMNMMMVKRNREGGGGDGGWGRGGRREPQVAQYSADAGLRWRLAHSLRPKVRPQAWQKRFSSGEKVLQVEHLFIGK